MPRAVAKQKVGRITTQAPLFPVAGSSRSSQSQTAGTTVADVFGTSSRAAAVAENFGTTHARDARNLIDNAKLCDLEILKILDETDIISSLKETLEELTKNGFFKGTPEHIKYFKDLELKTARLLLYEEMCKADEHFAPLPPLPQPSSSSRRKARNTANAAPEAQEVQVFDKPPATVLMLKGEVGRCNTVRNARNEIETFDGTIWYACMDNRREFTEQELRESDAKIKATVNPTMREFLVGQQRDGKLVEQVTFPEDFNINITAKSLNGRPRDWLVKMGYCDLDGNPLSDQKTDGSSSAEVNQLDAEMMEVDMEKENVDSSLGNKVDVEMGAVELCCGTSATGDTTADNDASDEGVDFDGQLVPGDVLTGSRNETDSLRNFSPDCTPCNGIAACGRTAVFVAPADVLEVASTRMSQIKIDDVVCDDFVMLPPKIDAETAGSSRNSQNAGIDPKLPSISDSDSDSESPVSSNSTTSSSTTSDMSLSPVVAEERQKLVEPTSSEKPQNASLVSPRDVKIEFADESFTKCEPTDAANHDAAPKPVATPDRRPPEVVLHEVESSDEEVVFDKEVKPHAKKEVQNDRISSVSSASNSSSDIEVLDESKNPSPMNKTGDRLMSTARAVNTLLQHSSVLPSNSAALSSNVSGNAKRASADGNFSAALGLPSVVLPSVPARKTLPREISNDGFEMNNIKAEISVVYQKNSSGSASRRSKD